MPAIIASDANMRSQMGIELTQQVEADIRNRGAWEAARLEARAFYYGDVVRPDIHFDDATNIHLGVVYENIERLVPKMNGAFWNIDPKIIVDRVPQEYDPEETRMQEWFINWAVENDIPDLYITTLAWFRNMLLDGVGVVKTRWVTTWRNTCEIHRLKTHQAKGQIGAPGAMDAPQQQGIQKPEMEEKSMADILDELFGVGAWHLEKDDEETGMIDLTIIEDRRVIEDVHVVFTGNSQFIDEVEILVYRPILVEDHPEVEVVEAEDLIVPHRTRNIQKARRVTHQHYMMVDEIVEQTNKAFDPWILEEGDEEVLWAYSRSQEAHDSYSEANRAFGRMKDDVEGTHDTKSAKDPVPVPIYEIYLSKDIDGDGKREELVLQVCPRLRKVLHITFLDVVHPHGHRPFSTIHFLAPSDRFYVPGLAMFLQPLNMQANITLNQINDRQTVINNPIGFYQPMALPQDPNVLEHLRPGDMVPSPNPAGIVFPDWGKAPLSDMTILNTIMGMADRVGSSPMLGGAMGNDSNPRTARGTMVLVSEGNLRVDTLITMAQREGFAELFYQLFGLYSVFMPDEKYFWATGHDRKRKPEMISRKLMRGRFEFRFRGNTVNTNPEVQRTLSQIRYQVASTNPLYGNDVAKFRELLRDFLQAHSDGASIERILPDLPGMGAESHPPMAQAEEIVAMRMHQPVDIHPADNDLKHMDEIIKFSQSPAFGSLDEVTVTLIAQHYQMHARSAQRKMQQAAIQGGGGAEQSVPTNGGMIDQGVGMLEGGVQ